MAAARGSYYLPNPSPWPVVTSAGLFCLALGFVLLINHVTPIGPVFMLIGVGVIVFVMFRWFGQVIGESEGGLYNKQVDRSFRWGMAWFIFSEVMFFAAFFGALFYIRMFAVPWIAGDHLLWPGFEGHWPTAGPQGPVAISPEQLPGPNQFSPMAAWGIPAINTLILLSSGVTITIAHWGLLRDNRGQLFTFQVLTIVLGLLFLALQAHEYAKAYTELGLTLGTGVYGATFFMLTGFHGFHVTMGCIMLSTILGRIIRGHFTPDHHFAFEAVAWYWHFVDVVWLFLFVFVYWLA
jgi:cytochrome c oxidase subunit 3